MQPFSFSELPVEHVKGTQFDLALRRVGNGEPLVLLHGYPQTSYTWEKVLPELSEHFECFVFDLPGYGESEALDLDAAPEFAVEENPYSKSAMALEIVEAMKRLGISQFSVLGHDRGARVSYRMALNHPEVVAKLGIVEIIPTAELWDQFDADLSVSAYHWGFLAKPHPLPETLILSNPEFYAKWTIDSWNTEGDAGSSPEAMASYLSQFLDPKRVRAFCEDYRAGFGIDREEDRQTLKAGKKIICPVFVLHSAHGFASDKEQTLDIWRRWADDVSGKAVVAGHFIQEELPAETTAAFIPFFSTQA